MNKLFGFKKMIIVSMVTLTSICLIISNLLHYLHVRDNIITNVHETSAKVIRYEANRIEVWFQSKVNLLEQLAKGYASGIYHDEFVSIARLTKATGEVSDVFFGFEDGRAYSTAVGDAWIDGVSKPEQYDPRKRFWYAKAKSNQSVNVSDVYQDLTSGHDVVSLMKQIGDGVALVDIELAILDETVKGIDYLAATATITDETGKVLVSNDENMLSGVLGIFPSKVT